MEKLGEKCDRTVSGETQDRCRYVKSMDQKRGEGQRNSKPTRVVPPWVFITRAIRQGSTSSVCTLAIRSLCEGDTSAESAGKPAHECRLHGAAAGYIGAAARKFAGRQ